MKTVYVETSIWSYLAARPSQDGFVLGAQELTRRWWSQSRQDCQLFVSPAVQQEVRQGDPEAAAARLAFLEGIEMLRPRDEIEPLAAEISQSLQLPARAFMDAIHLAYAIAYELDFLLIWNCAHLANAPRLRELADFCRQEQLWLPIICTPQEMVGTEQEIGNV